MPYIQGETLRDKLDRETQLGVDEAVRITTDVADALHYAHTQGVIHRDIKPENILLANGRPMVADFGIALALSAAAGGRMTETGLSLGTPHYMSPEQATAEKEITARSDVYSLASVCYEMLAGQPPHLGGAAQQIIMKIIAEPVQPVTQLRKSRAAQRGRGTRQGAREAARRPVRERQGVCRGSRQPCVHDAGNRPERISGSAVLEPLAGRLAISRRPPGARHPAHPRGGLASQCRARVGRARDAPRRDSRTGRLDHHCATEGHRLE